jgi:hypothetical protein
LSFADRTDPLTNAGGRAGLAVSSFVSFDFNPLPFLSPSLGDRSDSSSLPRTPRTSTAARYIPCTHPRLRLPYSPRITTTLTPRTMAYRPQPGPSFAPASSQAGPGPQQFNPPGRISPLPAVPQIGQPSLGHPGALAPTAGGQVGHAGHGGHGGQGGQGLHPGGGGGGGSSSSSSSPGDKGPDYVYFERKPAQFGESTAGKAMAAKMKLELYYKEAVEGVVGRKER